MPMPTKRILALLISASLTAGCAVGPDYIHPDPPLPERYLGQTAVEQRQATANAELIAWWTGFGDPQLTRFVALALEQNLDLAQAAARVAQARAGLGAANAALLPAGTISGQAARAYQSVETPLGQVLNSTADFDRYGNAYEANLGASWELDLFGGLRRGREAALAEYQASDAGASATRLAVAAQTADIYISIRGLQARLDIAHKQVQTQQELLARVNLLYSKGLAAELQVHQAEGALAQVQASVPVLDTALASAMNALDVMLGSPPGTHRTELAEVAAIPAAPQIAAIGSPSELLRRRPDLLAAERQLAASNARIGVAIAEYYPKLSLSGLIGSATSVSSGNLFVRTYRARESDWLKSRRYLHRIDTTPRKGAMTVCVPLPSAGDYAIVVQHDANGNREKDFSADGAGMSNNPGIRKILGLVPRPPSVDKVRFNAGSGVTRMAISMQYM